MPKINYSYFIINNLWIFTFLLVSNCHTEFYAQDLKLMTYNIRLDVASDGENAWPNRKEFLANQVLFYDPDIIGFQ